MCVWISERLNLSLSPCVHSSPEAVTPYEDNTFMTPTGRADHKHSMTDAGKGPMGPSVSSPLTPPKDFSNKPLVSVDGTATICPVGGGGSVHDKNGRRTQRPYFHPRGLKTRATYIVPVPFLLLAGAAASILRHLVAAAVVASAVGCFHGGGGVSVASV